MRLPQPLQLPPQTTIKPSETRNGSERKHTDDVIQPVIILIPRLKHNPQMQVPIPLRRPTGLEEDIRPVVRDDVIPRVRAEDLVSRQQSDPTRQRSPPRFEYCLPQSVHQ